MLRIVAKLCRTLMKHGNMKEVRRLEYCKQCAIRIYEIVVIGRMPISVNKDMLLLLGLESK